MALTDEEKLEATVEAFSRKLRNISSWNQMKNLITNISPTMVKGFLENKMNDQGDSFADSESIMAIKKQDHYDLADEIANL